MKSLITLQGLSMIIFKELNHQHQAVNSLKSTYSNPAGSLELPISRTNSGKSSVKYICASTCDSTLKDLSMKYIERCNNHPLWITKANVESVRNLLKSVFRMLLSHSILFFDLSNTLEKDL